MHDVLAADGIAIPALQSSEDDGRNDGQGSERHESLVNAMDHFGWPGMAAAGNEKRRRQSRGGYAEADRHLLHGAGD